MNFTWSCVRSSCARHLSDTRATGSVVRAHPVGRKTFSNQDLKMSSSIHPIFWEKHASGHGLQGAFKHSGCLAFSMMAAGILWLSVELKANTRLTVFRFHCLCTARLPSLSRQDKNYIWDVPVEKASLVHVVDSFCGARLDVGSNLQDSRSGVYENTRHWKVPPADPLQGPVPGPQTLGNRLEIGSSQTCRGQVLG